LQALGGGGSARGRKSATPRLSAEGGRSKDPPRHAPLLLLTPLLLPPPLLTPLLPAPRVRKVEGGESGGVVVDTRGAATRLW
jgi:hypothetical protein